MSKTSTKKTPAGKKGGATKVKPASPTGGGTKISPYRKYLNKHKDAIKEEFPSLGWNERQSHIAKMWKTSDENPENATGAEDDEEEVEQGGEGEAENEKADSE